MSAIFSGSLIMQGRVKWVENALFLAQSGSGHTITIDGPPDGGGQNLGVRPMEMVLLAVGGCSAYDVVHILKKARQPVTDCEVKLEAERADATPAVFTKIHMHFIVKGKKALKEAQVERAVSLSAEKYCSASIMLSKSVDITHSFEVQVDDGNE